ncbi:MAG: hydrogenase formation protein HypD [Clostridia bacterium]|nr:hydrogenase formation protein HypD [Clostridia bacterium]
MNNLRQALDFLKEYDGEPLTFMEVCGTHTAAIAQNGIPELLSAKIRLISGPGCPVCVTVAEYIDRLIELSLKPNTCVVSFGDMLRVPGKSSSLREAQAEGARAEMIYSPFELIEKAKANPGTEYVFAAVGFETTTPAYALLLEEAIAMGLDNIRLLTAIKTMPNAIDSLCSGGMKIDGFIAPGHVSVITGWREFEPLAQKYSLPFAVAGFEAEELIYAIYSLVKLRGRGRVVNLYPAAVTEKGNTKAKETVSKYFEPCDAAWRGMGIIPGSGLVLREEYSRFDAGSSELTHDEASNKGCRCGQVITGAVSPLECPLFGKICTPTAPQGACMVSGEGNCYNYFVNNRKV